MKKINFFFYLLIIVVTAYNTEDPIQEPKPDELPPITMTGENTFGFLLDGEVWIPKDDLSTNPLKNIFHTITYDEPSGTFSLQIENIDTIMNWDHLTRIACGFSEEGSYKMPPPPFDGRVLIDHDLGPCLKYYSNWETESQIEILKLDKSERIVAGLFEYTVHNDCGDTIQITEGRFDMKY